MKRLFLVAASLLLIVSAPVSAADFGFGIPDMVEEKVDELDQKVREYKAAQPLLDEFRETSIAVSNDTRDVIVDSTIAPGSFSNRIFVVLDINRPGEEALGLFQSDGEGKVLASESFDGESVKHKQMSIAPSDDYVDLLFTVGTDTGPAGVLTRRQTDNFLSRPGAGVAEVVIGSTASNLGQTDTAVKVNTFSYDDVEDNIYVSGDSGVFKVRTASTGDVLPSAWSSKFQEKFNVPEDNLVVDGDSIFVTVLEPYSSTPKDIKIKKIDADSTVVETDTFATSVSNPRVSLVASGNDLFLHYYDEGVPGDTIFRINRDDLTEEDSRTFDLSSHFLLKLVDQDQIFAEGMGGELFAFTKNPLNSDGNLSVSDTSPTLVLQGGLKELYGGTLDSAEASVFSVPQGFDSSSDTTVIFPRPGDVIDQEVCQSGNVAESVGEFFNRPVWLKDGFLGFIYGGSCIGWTKEAIDSSRLNSNSNWPHEDANNQRQRQPQN